MEVINVVVVDDNEILLRHLCDFLKPLTEIDVDRHVVRCNFHRLLPVRWSDDQSKVDLDATMQEVRTIAPSVAVIDLRLEGDDANDCSGIDLATKIMKSFDCRIVLVSSYFGTTEGQIRNFKFRVDRHKPDYDDELRRKFVAAVRSRIGTVRSEGTKNAVYISYARDEKAQDGASREEIVHRIEESLRRHGYDVRRDQTSLGYGKRLIPFMKEFRRGGCIVAVISDKYLRSPYCMYELLQSCRNRGFSAKVCPVVLLDGTAMSTPNGRILYVNYWERWVHDYEKSLQETSPSLLGKGSLDQLGFYRDIARNADELILFLAGMNWLDPETLEENDFAVLRNRIDECLRQVPKRRVRGQG